MDYPAFDVDNALLHLLRVLAGWTRADNAKWSGGVRLLGGAAAAADACGGWRIPAFFSLFPRGGQRSAAQFRSPPKGFDGGILLRALTAAAGRPRTHRLHDGFLDLAAFRRTAYYGAHYRGRDIADRLWAMVPLHEGVEAVFVFERSGGARRFTPREAALVLHVLRRLRSFHRRIFLSHGILAGGVPFSPVQRRVALELLTGKMEKEIAAAVGMSVGTTHEYVKEIYRHFGVGGRPGLMALWLGDPRLPPILEVGAPRNHR